jgi:hypothetical protein
MDGWTQSTCFNIFGNKKLFCNLFNLLCFSKLKTKQEGSSNLLRVVENSSRTFKSQATLEKILFSFLMFFEGLFEISIAKIMCRGTLEYC